MKLLTAITLAAAAAAGYAAARQLLDRETPDERLPAQLHPAYTAARSRLLLARSRALTVVAEFERERASAEAELTSDYLERVGRPLAGGSNVTPTAPSPRRT